MTIFEFIKANPGSASSDIARALNRTTQSVAGELSRLRSAGQIVICGERGNTALYRVNTLPFGCSNPLTFMFNQLLKKVRQQEKKCSR